MARIAESKMQRAGLRRNPVPPDPVGEERKVRILRCGVHSSGGDERVEVVEVRPRIGAHRVSRHAARKRAVVPGDPVAEGERIENHPVTSLEVARRQLVAEPVAIRRHARIPKERRHTVASGGRPTRVAPHDRGTALAGLDVLNMLRQRHDDRAPLLRRERLEDPVVGADGEDA